MKRVSRRREATPSTRLPDAIASDARRSLELAAQRAQLEKYFLMLVGTGLVFGIVLAAMAIAIREPRTGLVSVALFGFVIWAKRWSRRIDSFPVTAVMTRIGAGMMVVIAMGATAQTNAVGILSMATMLPVIVVLPYLSGTNLRRYLVGAWGLAVFVAVAGEIIPPVAGLPGWSQSVLRIGSMAAVCGLVLFLLWVFAGRLKNSTRELESLVDLSGDLSQTLDPKQIGDVMARHLAESIGADECGICYWDNSTDRVLTSGYFPPHRRSVVDESYHLDEYPATRRVLDRQEALSFNVVDADADPSEVSYLRSLGYRTMAMLPLVANGKSIGVVELFSFRDTAFDERRLVLSKTLAAEAAIALENGRLYEEIRHQAFHDGLTSLANRALFVDRLEHALARTRRTKEPLAVLFLDLDDFKLVNDRFGHAIGDQLLCAIADRLRSCLRPGDTAARLGGDEFAILLEDLSDPDRAQDVARRLIEAIRSPIRLGEADALVGVSLGVASSVNAGDTADELLRNADFAMYRAKGLGKGRFEIFEPNMREGLAERAELEGLIRGAAERGELRLQYQPIVNLTDGTIVAAEALVRWEPPEHRRLMPGDFIPLAEQTGEIVPIGRWVIGEAVRRARHWQELLGQPTFGVSVNLSAHQFQDPQLVSAIVDLLNEAHLSPSALTLEITESVLMQHTASTIERLAELRQLGIRLAIDDFGTGYSSLSYLERFPVDVLKIDRSFVEGVGRPRERGVLARAIIELGHALGLEVVAEGIERVEQLHHLQELDCRLGQGYLFARPLDPDALDVLLAGPDQPWDAQLVNLRPDLDLRPVKKRRVQDAAG